MAIALCLCSPLAGIAMHHLDRDRADRLLSLIETITEARGDALIAALD
jgi:hypothetical protein